MIKTEEIKFQPLLINEKQVRQLIGMTPPTSRAIGFPHPVDTGTTRKLWRRSEVEAWVEKLAKRAFSQPRRDW